MNERERFEKWIGGLPYERRVYRYSDDPTEATWPGQYRDDDVELAWDAWQAALKK